MTKQIEIARKAIKAYKADPEGSVAVVLELFDSIISNAARRFSNDADDREELKQDLSQKILRELMTRPIPSNPLAYLKKTSWNYCRDLYKKKKPLSAFRNIYGSAFTDVHPDEKTRRERQDIASVHHYIPGIDDSTLLDDAASPTDLGAASPMDYERRDLMRALDRMRYGDLERLYRREFPSDEFQGFIGASLDVIDAIYAFKRKGTDPNSIPGKFGRAWNTLRAAEKKMIPIFGRDAWNRALQAIKERNVWCGPQWGPDLDDCRPFKSLVNAFEQAKSEIDEMRLMYIPDVLFILSWTGKDGNKCFPDLLSINISPPRMIFDVWKRAAELKRGKRGAQENLNKMKLLFWYQKKKAEGTARERLFQKIRDDSDFENLRKYQYRKPRYKNAQETYRFLVDSIYQKSFRARDIMLRTT